MRIEYLYTEGDANADLPVRLDSIRVGTIRRVKDGWRYFPLHHKQGGDIFATAQEVQESLEFDKED
jgi:hypothetical protein